MVTCGNLWCVLRTLSVSSSSSGSSSSQSGSSDDEDIGPNSGNPDDSTTFGNTFAMGLDVSVCCPWIYFQHLICRTLVRVIKN